ncbi:MAG: hypothetical protein Q8P18_05530 [Pseudomonadota bacterium]|nr:hypothetical protein [Pseudomonadota bacterium]
MPMVLILWASIAQAGWLLTTNERNVEAYVPPEFVWKIDTYEAELPGEGVSIEYFKVWTSGEDWFRQVHDMFAYHHKLRGARSRGKPVCAEQDGLRVCVGELVVRTAAGPEQWAAATATILRSGLDAQAYGRDSRNGEYVVVKGSPEARAAHASLVDSVLRGWRVVGSHAAPVGTPEEAIARVGAYDDPDADGLAGEKDACPALSEDFDAWEDEDGCPDGSREAAQAVLCRAGGLEACVEVVFGPGAGQPGEKTELEALMRELAEKRWDEAVAPSVRASHYVQALAAAAPLTDLFPVGDSFYARLDQLRTLAREHHVAAAAEAGPLMGSLHRALAHRIDSSQPVPVPPALPGRVTLSVVLESLPDDCAWLAPPLAAEFGRARSSSAVPVRLDLACSHNSVLDPASSFSMKYTETERRKEMGEVRKTVTVREPYQCIQNQRVVNRDYSYDTVAVWGTCYRDVERYETVPGEVTVSYQVEKTALGTRQTRRLEAELYGTLQIEGLAPIPFTSKSSLQEEAIDAPVGPDVAFTGASLDRMDGVVAAELVAALWEEARQLESRRTAAIVATASRLADRPSAERDEAFLAALLLYEPPAFATAWLAERFGLSASELRAALIVR